MAMDTVRLRMRVHPGDILFIVSIVEAYEDIALMQTTDPKPAVMAAHVAPAFLDEFFLLIEELKKSCPIEFID